MRKVTEEVIKRVRANPGKFIQPKTDKDWQELVDIWADIAVAWRRSAQRWYFAWFWTFLGLLAAVGWILWGK